MIARWVIAGFFLWLAVALGFRFFGQQIFHPGSGVMWLFIVSPIVAAVVTYVLLKILRVGQSDRAEAASVIAVMGLLAGIVEINLYETIFPNLEAALGNQFAALMFACYAAVVFAGIVSSRLENI